MKWCDPFFRLRARIALHIHRRFFSKRHFWVSSLRPDVVKGQWCFECGTQRDHIYACATENRARQTCEPMAADYPNCFEVLEAFLFVRHPAVDERDGSFRLCTWCETVAREREEWA